MLSKRLIACLDVRNGCVVKGVNFEELREAGDPAALAARYNREGIDEVVVLDVTATIEGRRAFEAYWAVLLRPSVYIFWLAILAAVLLTWCALRR